MNAENPKEDQKNKDPEKMSHCQRLYRDFVEGKWSWNTEELLPQDKEATANNEKEVSNSTKHPINSEKEVKKRTPYVASSCAKSATSSKGNSVVEKCQQPRDPKYTQNTKKGLQETLQRQLAKERKYKQTSKEPCRETPCLDKERKNTKTLKDAGQEFLTQPLEKQQDAEPRIESQKQPARITPDYVLSFGEPSSIVEHEFTMSNHSASSFTYKDMVLRIYVPSISDLDQKMELSVSKNAVKFSSSVYDFKLKLPHLIIVDQSTARYCENCGGPHITVYLPLAAEVYNCSVNYKL